MLQDAAGLGVAGIGHNEGPPLVESQWHLVAWRMAVEEAWKNPPIEVVRRRLRRAPTAWRAHMVPINVARAERALVLVVMA